MPCLLAYHALPLMPYLLAYGTFTFGMMPCLCVHRLVLLAYDADKDNTPCLLGGSRAHWALVRGLALPPPCEAAQHMLVAAHASQQEADNHLGPRCHGACHPLAPAHDGTDGTAHDTARHHLAIPTAHIASGSPSSASGGGRSCSNTRSCLDVALEWCCAGAHASLPCSCWWCNDTCSGLRRQHAQQGRGEWEGIVALCVHGKVYRVSLQCCVACVCADEACMLVSKEMECPSSCHLPLMTPANDHDSRDMT